ncbi:hypothetical protein DYL61_08570 [Pseudomonas nabeulensis]|uniref:Uncharacterized protein n=1 Tax=Pseudomonas nabeulensis TaxID=2293833 RepID=A0A4Z0B678_9PSED|nr:hypothetical protein [Pseudomonas nabeulensis]TFY94516.1 hypothetical protein DYL61_08570 [Pseudomonas nabeulensis]
MTLSLPKPYQRKPGHRDTPLEFRWKEGAQTFKSDDGAMIWSDSPWGEGWVLHGVAGERYLTVYIFSNDEQRPIIGETFETGDDKSVFSYFDPNLGDHEGNYSITLTLIPKTLSCTATFSHIIPTIVEMTDGTINVI